MGYVWRSKKNSTAASAVRWSPEVSKKYTVPSNQKNVVHMWQKKYNADTAGAVNILNNLSAYKKKKQMSVSRLKQP